MGDYDDDTIEELGLTQPSVDNPYCGRHTWHQGSWADVTLRIGPIPWWEIVVYCADGGDLTKVETGYGPLSDFWPVIELIADGMLKAYRLDSLDTA